MATENVPDHSTGEGHELVFKYETPADLLMDVRNVAEADDLAATISVEGE